MAEDVSRARQTIAARSRRLSEPAPASAENTAIGITVTRLAVAE